MNVVQLCSCKDFELKKKNSAHQPDIYGLNGYGAHFPNMGRQSHYKYICLTVSQFLKMEKSAGKAFIHLIKIIFKH